MTCARTTSVVVMVAALARPAGADDAAIASSPPANDRGQVSFDVGLFGGAFFASSDHEFYDPMTSTPLDLGTAELDFGVRGSVFLFDYVGVEAEAMLLPSVSSDGGSILGLRGHVIGQYPAAVTPFAVAGLGTMGILSDSSVQGNDADMIAYAGIGARYDMWRSAEVRVDGRVIGAPKARSFGGETAHFELLIGASWRIGSVQLPTMSQPAPLPERDPDPDGDGIVGAADECPDEPGIEPDGCPLRDRDADGFVDGDDQCPDQPEVVNGFEDADGCPDEMPDTDGDGIADGADDCVNDAEDVDGFQDADGCPDSDNDADGLLDPADRCPDEAGPADNRGCPDSDRDGDGVVDRLDNCPDQAGTAANQGCVDKQLVIIRGSSLQILDTVLFRTNKATIHTKSYALLTNVAAVMLAHPELTKIEVAGHTDDIGKDEFNQWLSDQRASAVVAYLVDQGVAADRLVGVGYGESEPAVEGTSAAARKANRRVEFKVLESMVMSGSDGASGE